MGLFDGLFGGGDPQAEQLRAGIPALDRQKALDAKMAQMYVKSYPWLAPLMDDPKLLMEFIDHKAKYNSSLSPGASPSSFEKRIAEQALKEVYRMPNYITPGFERLDYSNDGSSQWVRGKNPNPRDIR